MKKLLSLVLTVILTVSLASGCSKNKQSLKNDQGEKLSQEKSFYYEPSKCSYFDLMNCDYLEMKLRYGEVGELFYYDGPMFRLPDGNSVGFSGVDYDIKSSSEISPFDVVTTIYCNASQFAQNMEDKAYSIEEFSKLTGFYFGNAEMNLMDDILMSSAKHNGVEITVYLEKDNSIKKTSTVVMRSIWATTEYKKKTSISSSGNDESEWEKEGPFYYSGRVLYKVDPKASGEIVIPEYINGSKIEIISQNAFKDCHNVTSVVIGKNVTRIGYEAFKGMKNLEKVEIPNSVDTIQAGAFEDCTKLKVANIPNGVRGIDNSAFEGCTSLEFAKIPMSISYLGHNIFKDCPNIKTFIFLGQDANYNPGTAGIHEIESDIEVLVLGGNLNMIPMGYFADSNKSGSFKPESLILESEMRGYTGGNYGSTLGRLGDTKIYSAYPYSEDLQEALDCKEENYISDANLFEIPCLWRFLQSNDVPCVVINDELLLGSTSALDDNDVIYPVERIFEKLDMRVEKSKGNNKLVAKGNAHTVEISAKDNKVTVDGEYVDINVILKDGVIFAPVGKIITAMQGKAEYIADNKMMYAELPVFTVENKDLIDVCSRTDYSFDLLYSGLDAQEDLEKVKKDLGDKYVDYLVSVLIEILISPEYNVFADSYGVAESAANLFPGKSLEIASKVYTTEEEIKRTLAIANVEANLNSLMAYTEDEDWKEAIKIVKEEIVNCQKLESNDSFRTVKYKEAFVEFMEEYVLDEFESLFKLEGLKDKLNVAAAFLDGLTGCRSKDDAQTQIIVTMPLRNAMVTLCNNLFKKIDEGQNKSHSGVLLTDKYLAESRILLNIMKSLSTQTCNAYNAEKNSGLDIFFRAITLQLDTLYDGQYFATYEEELDLFDSVYKK